MKKFEHKTKDERRRVLLSKNNELSYTFDNDKLPEGNGFGSAVLAKTREVNRRVVALVLALAFVLTTVVVGVNLMTKAQGHDEGGYGMMENVDPETGMVLRKGYAVTDEKDPENPDDDVYSLRLEAYATKDTTSKSFETNTPLDIVMVLDQSESMQTNKDVLKGRDLYQAADKADFTIDEIKNGDYYYCVNINGEDKYYKVQPKERDETVEESYLIVKENATKKDSWTAQEAYNWMINSANSGKHLFYDNNGTYEEVEPQQVEWYKNAGSSIPPTSFESTRSWSYNVNFPMNNTYYYNIASDSENPSWREVHMNYRGVFPLGGYYYYLWYYTEDVPSVTIPKDEFSSNTSNWGSTFRDAYTAGKVAFIPYVYSNGPGDGWSVGGSYMDKNYHAHYASVGAHSNYTGGKLYSRQNASSGNSGYNRLITLDDNNTESGELARPLIQTNPDINTNPGSSTWGSEDNPGYLYAAGYLLYYTDVNGVDHYIGTAVDNTDTSKAYVVSDNNDIQLYEKETITRLEAQNLAANNYAQTIATAMGDRDYRIAVVGNADGGNIYSGDTTATNAFVTANEDVESAITALTTDGTSADSTLANGLSKTADVFAANSFEAATDRKRVVIVFGDKETWETTNAGSDLKEAAQTADAVLKDTYNSTVYTIGLFKGATTSAEQFMRELSSEYFSSAANPTTYKEMGGTYHYLADSDVFPDEANSVISTFGTVATETAQVSATKFVLDNTTAFLKDVIHENFNLPDNPDASIDVQVATGSYNNGEWTWTNDPNAGDAAAAWDTNNPRVLKVTGFDYDANYISEDTGSGKKIIVTIDGLTVNQRVRTESKSAKRIYFNTTASGIYKDSAEELVVNKFPRPFLDDKTMLAPEGGTGKMSDDGVVVNKYLTPTENGTYDLTVEAYTTQTSTETIEKVPTDFVVVADQSGSMSTKDMPTDYEKVSGTLSLEDIANNDYYVKGDDGNYYRVYGTKSYMYRYYPANYWYVGDLITKFGARLSWFQAEKEQGQSITNQMYFREVKDGQTYYQPITMTVQGKIGAYYIRFNFDSALNGNNYIFDREVTTYSNNGNSPWYRNVFNGNVIKSGTLWSAADAAVQLLYPDDNAYTYSEVNLGIFGKITTGMYVNYPMYDRHVGYNQLLYRDANGTEHILPATTGQKNYEFCNDDGHALTSKTGSEPQYSGLYKATGYQSRLEALKNALTDFAQAVADESHLGNQIVDNRIAIVGFSSDGYSNTEVLTKTDASLPSTTNGWQKATADSNKTEYYGKALVNATDGTVGTVNSKIMAAIDALTANGGTQPEDGLDMAFDILDKRIEKTYEVVTDNNREVDRNTIVIYFTDGRPGNYTVSNQYGEANEVVTSAKNIKNYPNPNGSHPSVFSIGVFGESDGNPLTYTAHRETSENVEYEYDLGWMDTYYSSPYHYYLNRNWRSGSPADYGASASDTIFDYMSVVSSNYPNATQYMKVKSTNTEGEVDLTGYNNYLDMLDGVRGAYVGNNDYYRMASNQDTLVAAFKQAVTMMNQTISSEQRLDAAAVMQDVFNNTDFNVEDGYSIRATTVDGKMDKYGTVSFDESTEAPATGVVTSLRTVDGKQTVTVTGFDYLANYINCGYTDPNNGAVTEPHDGKKLVVTISNVVPTTTADKIFSNIWANNKSSLFVNDQTVPQTDFPTPSISRHSYTLDVRDVNRNAKFAVAMKILDGSGNEVSKDSSMLDDVILVYPNGTRKLYSEVGAQEFLNVGNGQSFYLENLPSGYQVQTDVISTDDAYKYKIWFDDDEEHKQDMIKGVAIPNTFSYADHVIHITSERGTKEVSVRERTIGSYGDTTHRFGEVITMEIPVIQGETPVTEFDCTFNDDFSGFENDLPSDATIYKAVFTVENPDATDTRIAKLTAIKYTMSDGTEGTWSLADNSDPVNYELPMRDGDVINFTKVPTGNTVKALEPDTYNHDVFYYYGQDDVSPSGIKLMTSSGNLLEGTHTLTLKNVDGLETDLLEVKFVDGSIAEVGGQEVDATTVIDFAKYQTMYVINDDLSDAKLNIDGTDVYFDTETDGSDTAYVATIKRQTVRPPVSVTVEKNDMDILIVNERGDIEIEGIFDNQHSKIIYILSGAGVLALAAGGYYVWKKKDEFVE